jgi:autotransporter-associated beta strand protein
VSASPTQAQAFHGAQHHRHTRFGHVQFGQCLYAFRHGKITGGTGLTKSGSGTLTILTPTNDYAGVTYIGGGIVNVTNLANGGSASAIGAAGAASGNLILDGGDLQYAGPTVSINRGATLNAGGGTVEVTTAASTLTLSGVIAGTTGSALTKLGERHTRAGR